MSARVALVVFVDRVAQIRSGHEHAGIFRSDLVARELLAHELVVWLVVVEAPDHVVAIRPRRGTVGILIVAIALRVAHEIEPVLRPALAVARAREQFVHELFVGVRVGVAGESIALLLRRRQSVQIEINTARKFAGIGFRRGIELLLGELLRDETIDVVACPVAGNLRRLRIGERLEAPEFALLIAEAALHHHGLVRIRPRRAELHPFFQRRDFFVGQLFLRRHLEVRILVTDRLDHRRLVRVAGHDRRAGVPAGLDVRDVIHAQPALLLFFAVAIVAARSEHRPYFILKKTQRVRLRGGGGGGEEGQDEEMLHGLKNYFTRSVDEDGRIALARLPHNEESHETVCILADKFRQLPHLRGDRTGIVAPQRGIPAGPAVRRRKSGTGNRMVNSCAAAAGRQPGGGGLQRHPLHS